LKHALRLDGVISSDAVAEGTLELSDGERRTFAARYKIIKERLAETTNATWISRPVNF